MHGKVAVEGMRGRMRTLKLEPGRILRGTGSTVWALMLPSSTLCGRPLGREGRKIGDSGQARLTQIQQSLPVAQTQAQITEQAGRVNESPVCFQGQTCLLGPLRRVIERFILGSRQLQLYLDTTRGQLLY